ncbi:hypothetical protein M422DRAFT_259107 [Sphaerobolus stellatus SS14]|uniref:Uncharacterized protein n=1 Tax=Sphaerobolus stellatus (strain SS14) TaxID=990650 RepID=A0A0C9U5D0_SPHS4|nr:hypothetical protein M422DRAFT_259107 [Sphaerobolus stellatus SS14]
MFSPNPPYPLPQTPPRPSSQAAPVQAKDDPTIAPLRATPSPTRLPLTRPNRPIPHINRVLAAVAASLADDKWASRLGGDTRQPRRGIQHAGQQGPPSSSFRGPSPAQSPSQGQGGLPPPTTFEQMGFAVGKAEEKDCVIM